MAHYVGILDGNGDIWGVRVPDLPGVNGGGATPEEAITDATSAARDWAEHHEAKGLAIPAPRAISEVLREVENGEATVMIPFSRSVDENPGRTSAPGF